MAKKDKRVLSLFSGCGGMDLGFEGDFKVLRASINENIKNDWVRGKKTGRWVKLKKTIFKTIFANDISPYARITWVNYFSKRGVNPNVFNLGSVVDYVKDTKKGMNIFPSNIDVVTGGFPCQDFSVAGKRKGFNSHKSHTGKLIDSYQEPNIENRGQLYMWMKEVIGITKPKVFIAENVKGLVNLSNVKEIIANDFRDIDGGGYLVIHPKVLSAANYGVSQNRERVFFIGFLRSALKKEALIALERDIVNDEYNPYPPPTHYSNICQKTDENIGKKPLYPLVTTREVLKDLPEPIEAKDLAQQSFSKAKYYGNKVQGQIEINLDGLAPTIRAEHHGNIEFRRLSLEHGGKYIKELNNGSSERRLTVRECARLQTFPDDYDFVIPPGDNQYNQNLSASQAYRLIGNAVPPLLAYHLARRLEGLWDKYFI